MSGAISSELVKLRTARSSIIVGLTGVGLAILFAVLSALFNNFTGRPGEVLITDTQFCLLFTLVLGVMAIAGEVRHGSIAPSLLVVPSRPRLMLAKLAAVAAAGLAIGLVAYGACLAVGAILLPGQGFELDFSASQVLVSIAAGGAVAALYAVMGLGVGAVLRNQTGAIVAVLVFLFLVDPLLATLFTGFAPYSLGGVLPAATGAASQSAADSPLSQGAALSVSVLYAAVLFAAGLAAFRRADITD